MQATPPLRHPYTIGPVTVRNRVLAAPMATRYADRDGRPTPTMIQYYSMLAATGVGMVVVEGALVAPEGQGWARQLRADDPVRQLPGLTELASALVERGAVPILQLHHAGRQTGPATNGNRPMVAPSPIPCPVHRGEPVELGIEQIQRLVIAFTDAARLAFKAGFLGVELHGAHGYLLHQFVSPLTNQRRDEYRLETPGVCRFPLEVVRAVRAACPGLLIGYRISARDYLPSGLTLPGAIDLSRALVGAGVDLLHVSGGMAGSLRGIDSIWGARSGLAVFRSESREIRRAVTVPVAVTGKIQFPSLADDIIARADADLIGLGRVLLRDPHWVDKARGLDDRPIRTCCWCERCQWHVKGCPDRLSSPPHLPIPGSPSATAPGGA